MAQTARDAASAWKSLVKSKDARWEEKIAGLSQEDVVKISHSAKFSITTDDKFFCIGSCFARNIEEHLIYNGVDVLSKKIVSPKEEWPHRANGIVNKFTTSSMLNEMQALADASTVDASLFEETSTGWLDLQLCPGMRPVCLERAIERRTYITQDYFSRIASASIVLITLGLNEVWEDTRSNRRLNAAPSYASVNREPGRYVLHITDEADNFADLEQIYRLAKGMNPALRFIVTVSPVPMSETFSGLDILVANALSKATLRSAAGRFVFGRDDVDYFPSFEMVTLSPRTTAYDNDCLHVSDQIVGEVVRRFLVDYMGHDVRETGFNELAYLAANPDVEIGVRSGALISGFHHWSANQSQLDAHSATPQ